MRDYVMKECENVSLDVCQRLNRVCINLSIVCTQQRCQLRIKRIVCLFLCTTFTDHTYDFSILFPFETETLQSLKCIIHITTTGNHNKYGLSGRGIKTHFFGKDQQPFLFFVLLVRSSFCFRSESSLAVLKQPQDQKK